MAERGYRIVKKLTMPLAERPPLSSRSKRQTIRTRDGLSLLDQAAVPARNLEQIETELTAAERSPRRRAGPIYALSRHCGNHLSRPELGGHSALGGFQSDLLLGSGGGLCWTLAAAADRLSALPFARGLVPDFRRLKR
jgi:hypothetical protein